MDVKWTSKALSDLARAHEFLAAVNKPAASRLVKALAAAAGRLGAHPRIGEILDEFAPREVRRILIGQHELRYEVIHTTIYVMRIWHTRERR